jgi:thiol-disulfide isomerase/thioredoxin
MKYFSLLLLLFSMSVFAKPEVGDIPPDFLGKNLAGEEILLSHYKGKVVVITFWATWCGPCKKELPVLGSLQKKLDPSDLQVISINHRDNRKNFKVMAEALKDHPLVLTFDKGNKIGRRYGVSGIPHMVILDREGKIKNTHVGYSESSMREMLLEIVELVNSTKTEQSES